MTIFKKIFHKKPQNAEGQTPSTATNVGDHSTPNSGVVSTPTSEEYTPLVGVSAAGVAGSRSGLHKTDTNDPRNPWNNLNGFVVPVPADWGRYKKAK